jgi:hypothetical protein
MFLWRSGREQRAKRGLQERIPKIGGYQETQKTENNTEQLIKQIGTAAAQITLGKINSAKEVNDRARSDHKECSNSDDDEPEKYAKNESHIGRNMVTV